MSAVEHDGLLDLGLEDADVKMVGSVLLDLFEKMPVLAGDPLYQDVTAVCKDGKICSSKLLLYIASPTFGNALLEEEDFGESILLLPDFEVKEITDLFSHFGDWEKNSNNVENEGIFKYFIIFFSKLR